MIKTIYRLNLTDWIILLYVHANEAARHKLLDVIGDLALIGTRIKGRVIVNKPGHKVQYEFAKKMAKKIKAKA